MGFAGWSERDGQNGWRRKGQSQLKPNFQVPRTHCCVEAISTILGSESRSDSIRIYISDRFVFISSYRLFYYLQYFTCKYIN